MSVLKTQKYRSRIPKRSEISLCLKTRTWVFGENTEMYKLNGGYVVLLATGYRAESNEVNCTVH